MKMPELEDYIINENEKQWKDRTYPEYNLEKYQKDMEKYLAWRKENRKPFRKVDGLWKDQIE